MENEDNILNLPSAEDLIGKEESDFNAKKKELSNKIIKNLKNNPLNISILLVMVFAIAIRLYYFISTYNQPLWWDELAYGSLAKNIIYGIWDGTPLILTETSIRPIMFPIIWSLLFKIGINELGVRIILELIPSALAVFAVYLIGKEAYSKQVGIYASFAFSVLWIHLFYTGRLLTNVPALPLIFFSIYFFLKSQRKEFNGNYFFISILLLGIASLIRYPNGMIFFAYLAFLIITVRTDLLKNKKFWVAGIIGLTPILIFFAYNYVTYDNIFPALLGSDYIESGSSKGKPLEFNTLKFTKYYLLDVFFYVFLIGIIFSALNLFLGYDRIKKINSLKGSLVLILIYLIYNSYFIFYLRAIEDRWLFPMSIALVIFFALGVDKIYSFSKKINKNLAIIIVIAILFAGAYYQINAVDDLVNAKKTSYSQMREGFLWLKENTPDDAIIAGSGIEPYAIYYSERRYHRLGDDEVDIDLIDADYFVVHGFTEQPQYILNYLHANIDKWQPLHAFFFDQQKTQPAVIIYKKVI